MINNTYDFRYETPNKGPFEITQFWANDTFYLQCGKIKIRYNIHRIIPYTSDTNVDGIISEKCNDVIFKYTS